MIFDFFRGRVFMDNFFTGILSFYFGDTIGIRKKKATGAAKNVQYSKMYKLLKANFNSHYPLVAFNSVDPISFPPKITFLKQRTDFPLSKVYTAIISTNWINNTCEYPCVGH